MKINVVYMQMNAEPQEFIVNLLDSTADIFANHCASEMSVTVQVYAARSWTNTAGLSDIAEHCVTTL